MLYHVPPLAPGSLHVRSTEDQNIFLEYPGSEARYRRGSQDALVRFLAVGDQMVTLLLHIEGIGAQVLEYVKGMSLLVLHWKLNGSIPAVLDTRIRVIS